MTTPKGWSLKEGDLRLYRFWEEYLQGEISLNPVSQLRDLTFWGLGSSLLWRQGLSYVSKGVWQHPWPLPTRHRSTLPSPSWKNQNVFTYCQISLRGGLNHHHFRSSASQQPCLIELYAMREMPNIVATSHMWVLSTCKVASTTEDMTVKYYFILVNLIAKATKNQWPLYFLYIFIGFRYDSRQWSLHSFSWSTSKTCHVEIIYRNRKSIYLPVWI